MTVQELIEELTRLKDAGFGETELVLSVTDHTDWTYNLDFPGFDVGNVYDEDGEFDDESDYVICEVSI
jgi:hypothetical protein